jgi:hypothetical protein
MNKEPPKVSILSTLLHLAGVVLFMTGIGKLIAASGSSPLMERPDPLLLFNMKYLILATGAAELLLSLYMFFGSNRSLQSGLVAWMAANFGLYRLGLLFIGVTAPCACLGNVTDMLGIGPSTSILLANIALIYLFLVGIVGFAISSRARKHSVAPEPLPDVDPVQAS